MFILLLHLSSRLHIQVSALDLPALDLPVLFQPSSSCPGFKRPSEASYCKQSRLRAYPSSILIYLDPLSLRASAHRSSSKKNPMPSWSSVTHVDLIFHNRWSLFWTCPRPSQEKLSEQSSEPRNGKHQDKTRLSETPKALAGVLSSPLLPCDVFILLKRNKTTHAEAMCDFCLCLVINTGQ